MGKRYTVEELAQKYFKTDKTIRNYIQQIANTYGFEASQLKRVNAKGVPEYELTEEQAQLLGIIIENIEEDVFLREKPAEKLEESKIKGYRDDLLKRVESIPNHTLKDKLKRTPEYQYGIELKRIHEEFDEMRDCTLFLLEQFPLKEKVEIERQILQHVKNLNHNLIVRFTKHLEREAVELLIDETFVETEDSYEWDEPTEEQIIYKVKELLIQRFRKKRLFDHQYAGYNLIERAIAQAMIETLGKSEQ